MNAAPTITVYVRHSAGCKCEGNELNKRCQCKRHLRWTHNRKRYRRMTFGAMGGDGSVYVFSYYSWEYHFSGYNPDVRVTTTLRAWVIAPKGGCIDQFGSFTIGKCGWWWHFSQLARC
jgi:hypothetical protein